MHMEHTHCPTHWSFEWIPLQQEQGVLAAGKSVPAIPSTIAVSQTLVAKHAIHFSQYPSIGTSEGKPDCRLNKELIFSLCV